jgi:hypothetical protein
LYGFEVVDGQETAPVLLYDGLRLDARIAHCLVDPDIYVSDGNVSLRVSPSNTVTSWAIATPPQPTLAATAGGALPAGKYRVAITHRAPTGEESAVGPYTEVAVDDQSAIAATFGAAPTGFRTIIYTTKPNGTELLLLASVPSTVVSVNINKAPLGRAAATEDLDPMPGAIFAAVWNGRLLAAVDNLVFWSEPMHYGLTHLAHNFMEFVEPVSMVAATETMEGFFVGQKSRTYFVRGSDPMDAVLHEAYPAGVIAGTLQMVPGARLPLEAPPTEPVPMWLATNGVFCVGLPSGLILPLTESRFVSQIATEGAALFEQRAGKNRYVATLRNPSENAFAMSDSFTAEVVRNGN